MESPVNEPEIEAFDELLVVVTSVEDEFDEELLEVLDEEFELEDVFEEVFDEVDEFEELVDEFDDVFDEVPEFWVEADDPAFTFLDVVVLVDLFVFVAAALVAFIEDETDEAV